MDITVQKFGMLPGGDIVSLYALDNDTGMRAEILDYGAVVHALHVPDSHGNRVDVVLGQADLAGYVEGNFFLGTVIGRNCNRVADATCILDGHKCQLEKNDGDNNLHSGTNGLHKRLFTAELGTDGPEPFLRLRHRLAHLSDGFPGNMDVQIEYRLTRDNALHMEYRARSDAVTIANFTNHSYFNLRGHDSGSVLDHRLWLNAPCYLPATPDKLITGEIRLVKGTPMDFTVAKPLGEAISTGFPMIAQYGGFDVCYAMAGRGERHIATLSEPANRLAMEVYSDLPGMQLFTGNSLSPDKPRKNGIRYHRHQGVCFESEFFPNAVNIPWFPSPVLAAGKEFFSKTIYKFINY